MPADAPSDVPPSAYGTPTREVEHVTIDNPRCVYCRRKWALKVTTPFEFRCDKCGRRQTDRSPIGGPPGS